jgi:hypothetical protein
VKINPFGFIVKRFGFLKAIPLVARVFDSQLKLITFIAKPYLLDYIDEVEAEVLKWPGTRSGMHKYGGLQFNYHDKELGHIHSNGLVDILLNLKAKQQLMTEGRITDHHTFVNSGWISFYMRTDEDKLYTIKLFKAAYSKFTPKD